MATIKRRASAAWQGTGKDGKGHLTTQSGTLKDTPYSFTARFGDGQGTNPEELIAAGAKANCPVSKVLNAEITLEATLE